MEIPTPDQWRRIDDLLENGDLIRAMKLYCEFTGEGIPVAKETIYERAHLRYPALAATMGQIVDNE